jgi:hypothetical protein
MMRWATTQTQTWRWLGRALLLAQGLVLRGGQVFTLAEARDSMDNLCEFFKARIAFRPSDAHHSLYWLEEHAYLCRSMDHLTTYREPLVQAAITQFMAPGGGV